MIGNRQLLRLDSNESRLRALQFVKSVGFIVSNGVLFPVRCAADLRWIQEFLAIPVEVRFLRGGFG